MTSQTNGSPSDHAGVPSKQKPIAAKGPKQPAAQRRSRSIFFPLNPLVRSMELFGLVLKRQRHHPGLTLLGLLGVVLTVGLITSASFFSAGVQRVILNKRLSEFSRMTGRPAFSTRVYFYPSSRRPMSLTAVEEMASYVAGTLAAEVGLPVKYLGVQVGSGGVMLQPAKESGLFGEERSYLGSVKLVYKAKIEDHVEMIDGQPIDDRASGEVLDVWMHNRLAEEMGLHVGEELSIGPTLADVPRPIRLMGFWQARDPTAPYWFSDPDSTLKDALLVRRQDYGTHVAPMVPSGTRFVQWHVILDESKVGPADARGYVSGFERGLIILNKHLPNARLDTPPLDPLKEFVDRETVLTILLLGFNIPAYGFLLYFLILVSAITAYWQRQETSVLVSRGMSILGVLGLTLVEELMLFVVGFPLGLGFGILLARLMGYTSSFLSFTPRSPLPISLQFLSMPLTLVALVVPLVARLWPIARAARQSVVESGRERARPLRSPFWYRYYLDLLLAVPTAYAYRQLADKGTLALLVRDRPEDLYRDPLLVLVPALFILTAGLMVMRFFPLIMRVIDRLASLMPWITPHLALRQLGRRSQSYINPLLLIILSLAFGVYTQSMAASLDQWLIDRMYFRVGADLTFAPLPMGTAALPPHERAAQVEAIGGNWIPLPEEFGDLPGVTAATRVGDYRVGRQSGRDEIRGRFLAIDRLSFPSVAWFRHDFADEPLGALMNRLAALPDGILVSEQFLNEKHLQVGDTIPLRVVVSDELEASAQFSVVGAYKYFPTVYEEDDVTFIGNLDYLSSLLGVTAPHHIWLRTQDDADGRAVIESAERKRIDTALRRDARVLIVEEQAKPERVGVFGTLSVGFLAGVIMAAVGLLTFSYASLQERLFRLTVLHAVGLMRRQIVAQVVLEYAFLTVYGAVSGAYVGTLASALFVPFFRVTGESGIPLPPLIPIVARQEVVSLVAIFVCAMILMEVLVIARALSRRRFSLLGGFSG